MSMGPIQKGVALLNKRGQWFFSRLEDSGTVVARSPVGDDYVVPRGDLTTREGQRLLNDMVAALTAPAQEVPA